MICAVVNKNSERIDRLHVVQWDRHRLNAVSQVTDGTCLRHNVGIRVENRDDQFWSEGIFEEIRYL